MAVLKFPPVLFFRASNPTAMFCCPYVLEYSEFFPIAVFLKPEVLDLRASSPIAVLLEPLVFAFKASSVKFYLVSSNSNSRWYCFTRAFLGSVKIVTKAS